MSHDFGGGKKLTATRPGPVKGSMRSARYFKGLSYFFCGLPMPWADLATTSTRTSN